MIFIMVTWNPIDLIPTTIDPNLRKVLIFLIVFQFTAFLIYMVLMVREYKRFKREGPRPEELEEETKQSESNLAQSDKKLKSS